MDNGLGIAESIKSDIFNPFFTTKPSHQGHTGLGLSITFDIIVHRHGGRIEFESNEGSFSEFKIVLPVRQ